jgi:hypothetical protein
MRYESDSFDMIKVDGKEMICMTYVHRYQQQGPAAEDAVNVYYYLTYEGGANLDAIVDPCLRHSAEAQVALIVIRDGKEEREGIE